MILDRNTLQSLFAGVMEFFYDGVGVIPCRFSKNQYQVVLDDWDNPEPAFDTASVMLDFWTDSDTFRMVLDGWRERSCNSFRFDILVDGVLIRPCRQEFETEDSKELVPFDPIDVELPLGKGEKRVTVVFPWSLPTRLHAVELSDGAAVRPHACKRTWIAFGDSITHGCRAYMPSMAYVTQLSRLLDARVYNFGIGGQCFHSKYLVPGTYPKCDFVTIAYGTNDYRHASREQFDREMPEFFRKAAAEFAHVPVFVILPLWRLQEAQGKIWDMGRTLEEVRQLIRQEIAKYPNMIPVEGEKLVPHCQEFFQDKVQLHPNDLGFTHMAMNLYREIAPVLGV